MTARHDWTLGLLALGLALAAPVQAAPDPFMEPVWMVAKREAERDIRRDARDARAEDYRGQRREAEREGPEGYGYGYERRQQQRDTHDDRRRERR